MPSSTPPPDEDPVIITKSLVPRVAHSTRRDIVLIILLLCTVVPMAIQTSFELPVIDFNAHISRLPSRPPGIDFLTFSGSRLPSIPTQNKAPPVQASDSMDDLAMLVDHLHPNKTPQPKSESSSSTVITLPTTLDSFYLGKNTPHGKLVSNESWEQPYVIASLARPFRENATFNELVVFTTGVSMGLFERNWKPVACLVSSDAYEVVQQITDVTICLVPRPIKKDEIISLLFPRETIDKALEKPEKLKLNLTVQLDVSRIQSPSTNTVLHFESSTNLSSFVTLVSNRTFGFDTSTLPATHLKYNEWPRYAICAVTQIRRTTHLLQPWIDYHRKVGIDYFFILDNNDPEDLAGLFTNRSDVDVFFWPWNKSQQQALTHAMILARHTCEAIAVFDADEYMMTGIGKNGELAGNRPVGAFVQRRFREGYGSIQFPQLTMSHSAQLRLPKVPPPEVYVHSFKEPWFNVKSVYRTDYEWVLSQIHRAAARGWVDAWRSKNDTWYPVEADDPGGVVHYKFRSYEEMVMKSNMGTGCAADGHTAETKQVELDINKAPWHYTQKDDKMKYTHFREIWRKVNEVGVVSKQLVVQTGKRGRCSRVYDREKRKWDGEELCEMVEEGASGQEEEEE